MTATTAAVVQTKQEILAAALRSAPKDEKYGTAEARVAIVTKTGEIYKAVYNDVEIASVKRVEDLAGLLIDHRYTMKAKWAEVTELKFECEVPAGTPNKGGMKKAGGKVAELKNSIAALIPGELEKATKDQMIAALTAIGELIAKE